MKYARVLLSNCPRRTTDLFIEYYNGQFKPRTEVEPPAEPQAQSVSTLQNLAAFLPLSLMSTSGTRADTVEPATEAPDETTQQIPEYQVPKPRTAFSAFVGHPQEFIAFLEALIAQDDVKNDDKVDLYTTLFEMYLDTANRKKGAEEKEEWETKAKQLIEGKDVSIVPFLVLFAPIDCSRFPSLPPMFYCCQSFPASEKGRPWCENRRASARIYSGLLHLPRTRMAPLRL